LAANGKLRLTTIDAEESIERAEIVFGYSITMIKTTRRTARDGRRNILLSRTRERRGVGFTFRETLHEAGLCGRRRLLLGGVRVFLEMNSSGRVQDMSISP
jgi:hypothetical protein